jgi:hypothetical protein
MLIKGRSKAENLFLKSNNTTITISGSPIAFFGYKIDGGDSHISDGIWTEWKFENNRFELKNDRYGFYPMYYFNTNDSFGVSPNIFDVLRECPSVELNDPAISVFLRLGFYIDNDTPFKNIHTVPPASRLLLNADGFTIESLKGFQTTNNYRMSRSAAVKVYGEIFQSEMLKYNLDINEKIVLPLSGGRDSRHILFALLKNGSAPDFCITVKPEPPKSSEDMVVASIVTKYLNISHHILMQTHGMLEAELKKNVITNLCSDEHSWILPVRNYLDNNSHTIVFDGIGGDVLSQSSFLNKKRLDLYEADRLCELAEDILGSEGYLPKMLQRSYYRKWNRELAVNHLVVELKKYSNRINPIGQFFFWNRTRREIALSSYCILNRKCHVYAPYLLQNIYDFLSSLPVSYVLDGKFHTDAISIYYPEYAHLPYETRSAPDTVSNKIDIRKYVYEVVKYCMFSRASNNMINCSSFVLPRAIKGLVDSVYGTNLKMYLNKSVYLAQLANLITDSSED